jgi:hypothetical protein
VAVQAVLGVDAQRLALADRLLLALLAGDDGAQLGRFATADGANPAPNADAFNRTTL